MLIPCDGMKYMSMNDEYLYYTMETGLIAVNLQNMEETILDIDAEVGGINVFDDETIVVTGDNDYYYVDGVYTYCIGNIDDYLEWYKSKNGHEANRYGDQVFNVYLAASGKEWIFSSCHYYIRQHSDVSEGTLFYDEISGSAVICPEHVAVYDGKVYMLQQFAGSTGRKYKNNMDYGTKRLGDSVMCFDPVTAESYVVVAMETEEQQIVGFSVENDELYTLEEGIIYRSTLSGEDKSYVASYVGSDTLSFEDVNDQLMVIRDGDIQFY